MTLLSIMCFLLIAGIVFHQSLQGLFSALIMALVTLAVTMAAFTFHEPLAGLLVEHQPLHAEAIALMALTVLPLLAVRYAVDRFLPGNVVPTVWVDRVGGGLLGLVTALLIVGTLAIALQMLPWGRGMWWGYDPYDDNLAPKRGMFPDAPAFTLGTVKLLSRTGMGGRQSFGRMHDDLVMELWATRNRWEEGGQAPRASYSREEPKAVPKVARNSVTPGCLTSAQVFDVSKQPYPDPAKRGSFAVQTAAWPLDTSATEGRSRVLVVRATVTRDAADADRWWRLKGTHFRLVTQDGTSFYPVAYLIREAPWKIVEEPIGQLQVNRSSQSDAQLTVDWVYRVPDLDDGPREPWFLAFRRIAKVSLTKASEGMPGPAGALQAKLVVGSVAVVAPDSARSNFIIKPSQADVTAELPAAFAWTSGARDGPASKRIESEIVEGEIKAGQWFKGSIAGRADRLRTLEGGSINVIGQFWQPPGMRVLRLTGEPPESGVVQSFAKLGALVFQPSVTVRTEDPGGKTESTMTLPAVGAWLLWSEGNVTHTYVTYHPQPSEQEKLAWGSMGGGGGPLAEFSRLLREHVNQVGQCGVLFLVPDDATVLSFKLSEGATEARCQSPMKVSDGK